ncbi:MAG: DUF1707 SHOCT-like domain-containing protein [Solirubrobacteraceae bacterium]
MSEPGALRASDAEREHVAQQLREHFAAGRIDADELAKRLEAVYGARTVGELAAQREDLPDLPMPVGALRAELAGRRVALRRQLVQQVGGSLGLFGGCVAIWAVTGAAAFFWPVFVLIGPAGFLARNLWRLYGPAPELDRVEAELRRHRRHHGHSRGRRSGRSGRSGRGTRGLAAGRPLDSIGAPAAEAEEGAFGTGGRDG